MPPPAEGKSYGQILKSSALIGGSSVINQGLALVRIKLMAVLLGTSGVGLFGVYWSILDLVRSIAGMGINQSGVRQIAAAVGTGDEMRIARTVMTLRRTALMLGAVGGLALVGLCRPISEFSFGDLNHAGAVALLGLAAFFYDVSAGQTAVVQGMRRLGDLARLGVFGALYGTVFGMGIVYFFYQRGEAERGVVPSLVVVAAFTILTSWWYSRRIRVARVQMSWAESRAEVAGLLNLGFIFMLVSLLGLGVAYLVRTLVFRQLGADAAGCYHAAWALGGMFIGYILQAMGTDFYPRLTAVANDNQACNRLVNEQAEVGLLFAGPGVLGTLTLAPIIVPLLYEVQFAPAVEVLRWICLGMLLRVASWPMGFILAAKGVRGLILGSELAAAASQLGFAWLGVRYFGLNGTGVAFFASYVFYWFLIYGIVRTASNFRMSAMNQRLTLWYGGLIAVVFFAHYYLPLALTIPLGLLLTVGAGYSSLRMLLALVGVARMPRMALRLVRWLKLIPESETAL